jgi:hypothetical protein
VDEIELLINKKDKVDKLRRLLTDIVNENNLISLREIVIDNTKYNEEDVPTK